MRTYLHEFSCVASILSKTFPWKKNAIMSSISTLVTVLCFSEYLGDSLVDNVALLYSPHNAKLIYLIVFYIPLCIPMVYTMLYMQIQIGEEYLYSRIRGRSVIIFVKILIILVANIFSTFIELIIVVFYHISCYECFSLDKDIGIVICLGVWRFLQKTILTLMLLLHESRKKNVISLFIFLTGTILAIAYGFLGESGLWTYSFSSAGNIIVQYSFGVFFLLAAIIYTDYIRDISL